MIKCIGCRKFTNVDELTPIHHFYCGSFGSHGRPFQAYQSDDAWDEYEDERQNGGICKECMDTTHVLLSAKGFSSLTRSS